MPASHLDRLDRKALDRLHDSMAAHVASGRLPGIGWDGGTGTTWRSSPRSGATGILFSQRQATSPVPAPLIEDFWVGVNAATATP